MDVIVYDTVSNMGTRMGASTNQGEFGVGTTDVDGLPVSTSDRTVTLAALAREVGSCDEDVFNEDGELGTLGPIPGPSRSR